MRTILALLATVLSASATSGVQWQIGVVDSGIGGEYSSLRLDKWGNAHVAYVDSNDANLKYAFWDHQLNKWFTTTLDRTRGFCSLALDSEQRPHISYLDYGDARVKYARWTGATWEKQSIPVRAKNISFYTSIALTLDDRPSITYYEYEGPDGEQELHLRNVTLSAGQWELRTVDSTPGSGKFNSIATDSRGYQQIAYGNVKYEDASLRYANWNGRSWSVEILEGAGQPGTSMWSVSLCVDKADRPHIAYTDVRNRLIKHAVKTNGKWNLEVVDSIRKEGYPDRNGIALDDAGNLYISYFDAGAGLLKLAHKEGRQWVTETVDRGFAGFTNSLQICQGAIWLTYSDQSRKDLKFARRMLQNGPALPQSSTVLPDSARHGEGQQ
jgi:hypothetical protein